MDFRDRQPRSSIVNNSQNRNSPISYEFCFFYDFGVDLGSILEGLAHLLVSFAFIFRILVGIWDPVFLSDF